jgi:hypothetical protein
MTIQANFPALKPALLLDFQNTKQLDSRITYTRASTASFYNGVTTAKAEENLLTYSQEFDNAAWTKTDATVTANSTTAPDGTTTADTISFTNNAITRIFQTYSTNGSAYIFSFYAKYIDKQWLAVRLTDGSNTVRFAWLDVQNGALGTVETNLTATITASTNGFYRCVVSVSATSVASNAFAIYGVSANGTTANTGVTGSLYLWGAQLEQRSAVTAYTATTTQAITNYIPVLQTAASGVARFDNNPTTGESLGLLIEESRTNLTTYSSQFDNAGWSKNASTITADTIVAPDGTLTGDKLVENTASGQHYITGVSSALATTSTFSCYAKAGERSRIQIGSYIQTYCIFNLSSQTTTITNAFGWPTATATITLVGNGWYRCTFTVGTGGSAYNPAFAIGIVDNSGNVSYTGDGFSGIYIWGAQLELGSFATSYIPTVASQVTRAADAASMTGTNFSSWFNAGQGTVYSDSLPLTVSSARVLSISDNTASNRMMVISSNVSHLFVTTNGTTVADLDGGTYSSTTTNRQGSAYAASDYAVSLNSGTVATSTSGALPSGLNRLYIGANHDGTALFLNGTIKKIAYYSLRISNAQLQALTS